MFEVRPRLVSISLQLCSDWPGWTHCLSVFEGSRVTYTIQGGGTQLAALSAARGDVPHNITVNPETFQRLGLGCHHLKLEASNMVTVPPLLVHLQVPTLHQPSALEVIHSSVSYQHQRLLSICLYGTKLHIKMLPFLFRPGVVDHFNMDYF